jgi:hypothetical protein
MLIWTFEPVGQNLLLILSAALLKIDWQLLLPFAFQINKYTPRRSKIGSESARKFPRLDQVLNYEGYRFDKS